MKIFVVLALVLAGVWLFRASRKSARQRAPTFNKSAEKPADQSTPMALDMVRCSHCDTHLPKADAVNGKQGTYCSAEHRQHAES